MSNWMVRKCDRCDVEYRESWQLDILARTPTFNPPSSWQTVGENDHLCHTCAAEFKKFMNLPKAADG